MVDLQKICTLPAGGFEQADLQTVLGRAPIKISLQTRAYCEKRHFTETQHRTAAWVTRAIYLLLLVTLCAEICELIQASPRGEGGREVVTQPFFTASFIAVIYYFLVIFPIFNNCTAFGFKALNVKHRCPDFHLHKGQKGFRTHTHILHPPTQVILL